MDYYSISVVDFSFYPPPSPYVKFLRAMRPKVRLVYTDHRSHQPELPRSSGMRHFLRRLALHQYNRIFAISILLAKRFATVLDCVFPAVSYLSIPLDSTQIPRHARKSGPVLGRKTIS